MSLCETVFNICHWDGKRMRLGSQYLNQDELRCTLETYQLDNCRDLEALS